MDALSFVKFWLTNNTNGNKPRREIRISESVVESSTALGDSEVDLCEEDDSFFELEISLSDFSLKKNKIPEETEEKQNTFPVSKSKVLPFVETTSKPQSPITLLQPSEKLRAFSFKNSTTTEKKEPNSRSLNVRFRFEDETTRCEDSASSVPSSSKRFFDLIKPLYNKTTKKQSINSVSTSPASSPAAREKQRSNITRSVRRQLGKSRSASATVGAMSPVKRLDESLQVQQDGIQSAILHCKKSFHGSRGMQE